MRSTLFTLLFTFSSTVLALTPVANLRAPNGFQLSTSIETLYKQNVNEGLAGQAVQFRLAMKTPGIATSDIGAIKDVICNDREILLTIPDSTHYNIALNWKTPMTLFVTHKWHCNGQNTNQLFLIKKVETLKNNNTKSSNDKLRLTVEPADLKEHAGEFELSMNYENENPSSTPLYRRRSGGSTSATLAKRIGFDKSTKINLSINSAGDKKAKKENMPLYNSSAPGVEGELLCKECFTEGSATIKLSAHGRIFPFPKVTRASLSLDGNLHINADFSVKGSENFKTITIAQQNLFTLDTQAFQIPGIFNVGPMLRTVASAGFAVNATEKIDLGIGISFPDFHAELNLKHIHKTGVKGFSPKVTFHSPNPNLHSRVEGSLSLTHQIMFHLNILSGMFDFKGGVEVTGSIGVSVEDDSKNIKCPYFPNANFFLTGNVGVVSGFNTDNAQNFPILPLPHINLVNMCIKPSPRSKNKSKSTLKGKRNELFNSPS